MHQKFYPFIAFLFICFLGSSCLKKEQPLPLPPPGDAESQLVNIGNDYATQVFYSFTNGIVKSDSFDIWDIAFDVHPDQNELWLNGGSNIMVYPSGQSDFNLPMPSLTNKQWMYDKPEGTYGLSALGALTPESHIGELLFLQKGSQTFKLKILEATSDHYKIEVGGVNDASGIMVVLQKEEQYNFVYYSFSNGIVQPEPVKTDWDFVFTRYRTIFPGLNADGSDMPYIVNGVLLNTFKTLGASDSTKEFNFAEFDLAASSQFTLSPNRDIIGYNWKAVNINTAEYTVLPKRMFLLKDQLNQLWKFHFVSFYDENGQRGNPRFEFKRLE